MEIVSLSQGLILWLRLLKRVKVEKVVNTSNLYQYILFNLNTLSEDMLLYLLDDLECTVHASFLQSKFKDTRSISTLKTMIKQEYKVV